jgi:cysteine desulfurase
MVVFLYTYIYLLYFILFVFLLLDCSIDIKRGVKIQKQMHGASHERDLRAGTENIILLAGLGLSPSFLSPSPLTICKGKASEVAKRDLEKNAKNMKDMRDRLHQVLLKQK